VSRVNIVKRIKIDGLWKMFSIPHNAKGNYDWNAIAYGRYCVEWYVGGTRRREGAGVTAAQALGAQRRKRHELEGWKLGVPGFPTASETFKKPALRVTVKKVPAVSVPFSMGTVLRSPGYAERRIGTNRISTR
jgi:hypothetical protein